MFSSAATTGADGDARARKRDRVLRKKAAKLELEESKNVPLDPKFVSALEKSLFNVYTFLRPTQFDYQQREFMVDIFNVIANVVFGNTDGFPIVEAFGSFTMDLFTTTSDLDLSVNFSDKIDECPRKDKISALRKLARLLYAHQGEGLVSGVQPITSANVPVLKVVDNSTGIECDISVENKDGIARSRIISMVSLIDERFHILSYLVKLWAKAHKINCSKDHTLSSLSIVYLVAFHLQTRDPPILPPFSLLLKDGIVWSSIRKAAQGFINFGRKNKETVAELFVTLLVKLLSIEKLWERGLCASIYRGLWISKTWASGVGIINVEDFLVRSQNVSRTVNKPQKEIIYRYIRKSITCLSRFSNGEMEAAKFEKMLFGYSFSHMPLCQLRYMQEMNRKRSLFSSGGTSYMETASAKKMRYNEGAGKLHKFGYGKSNFPEDLSYGENQHTCPTQFLHRMHHFKPNPPQSGKMFQNPLQQGCFSHITGRTIKFIS